MENTVENDKTKEKQTQLTEKKKQKNNKKKLNKTNQKKSMKQRENKPEENPENIQRGLMKGKHNNCIILAKCSFC